MGEKVNRTKKSVTKSTVREFSINVLLEDKSVGLNINLKGNKISRIEMLGALEVLKQNLMDVIVD